MEQQNNNFKWYILNVMAGQENKIASEIKSLMVRGVLKNNVSEVIVPTKPIIRIKRGQKVQEMQKLFPGYVFVYSDLTTEIYNTINSLPKVMGFLGTKNHAHPVSDTKMLDVLKLTSEQEPDNKNVFFEIGETVNITEGPFESFSGVVEDFDSEKQKLKISVLIFGRATSVELNINQVEKIS
jgi:transcriptional antiterminator NusG